MTDYEELLKVLNDNGDKRYDEFNRKITKTSVRSVGCKTPFIRKLAKKFKNAEEVLSIPTNEWYEVDLLKGIVVSNAELPFREKSGLLVKFAETIENWAVCDCSAVNVPKTERDDYFAFFVNLTKSDKTFVCRYGIVNLLCNYLDSEYIDAVFGSLNGISLFNDYYVDMAAAWLIATAMTKLREETVAYMEHDGRRVLNAFTYNKALQKMRDSYMVSAEDKEWTRRMKI